MNEFLVKLIQNANNGGGNPYHDAEGKFTSGPNSSFSSDFYNNFSDYEAPTGVGKNYKNEKAANTLDRALDGMTRLGMNLKNKNKEEALEYIKNVDGDISKLLREKISKEERFAGEHVYEAAGRILSAKNTVQNLFKRKGNLSKMKDKAKRDFRAEKISKEIDKEIKDLNTLMKKNPNFDSFDKQIFKDELGMLQTLKYLDYKD